MADFRPHPRWKKYTYSGIAAMFRRYVKKSGLADFGLYDIKAKGATDMYQASVPLERVPHLLGHDRVTTTQIYTKFRLPNVTMPNMRQIPAAPERESAAPMPAA